MSLPLPFPTDLQLIVLDVDGVLSAGEAAPFDFAMLQYLAACNDRARHDPTQPGITLCTGRPSAYVEVLMQVIHGIYPAIFEHGAGLYMPVPYAFKWHAALTPEIQALLIRLQTELHQALVVPNLAYLQPGKAASLSLFAQSGVSLQEVLRQAGQLADAYDDVFVVEMGATCVNILIRGFDKAAGVRWLADETGIPLQHMAGVGDARGDVSFMRLLGWSAAPANAHAAVKQAVHYTSSYENGQGLMDILERLLGT
jgi:hydroxymethylpyrimidine pyrophosphatase-like HAD family hydrolase